MQTRASMKSRANREPGPGRGRRQVALLAVLEALRILAFCSARRSRSCLAGPSCPSRRLGARRAAASASLRVGVGRPLPPSLTRVGSAVVSSYLVRRNNGSASQFGREGWFPGGPAYRAEPSYCARTVPAVGWTRPTHDLTDEGGPPRMSLMKRISLIFRSKANKALDRAEDPRETLDYSYQRQVELLARSAAAWPTWPPAASASSSRSPSSSSRRTSSPSRRRRRSRWGREDLAREALTRSRPAEPGAATCKPQQAQLQGEEEKLTLASQRLQAKVEAFRTKKETIKATYTAAEAQTRSTRPSPASPRRWATSAWRAARRGQDRADAGAGRRHRRADRLRRPRRRHRDRPGRRHRPRARGDVAQSDVEAELAALKAGSRHVAPGRPRGGRHRRRRGGCGGAAAGRSQS